MNTGDSIQLRHFRIARRDGVSIEAAAELVGMSIAEARLTDAEDTRNPPPPEAFELPRPIGHNSGETSMSDNVAADQLRLFFERIERLQEEAKGLAEDIKDVFSEAKGNGYDVKIMRKVLRLRAMESHDRAEMEALMETYCNAVGIQYGMAL